MVGRPEKVTAGGTVAEGMVAAGTVGPRGRVAARAVETAEVSGARGCRAVGATKVARLAKAGCRAAGATKVARCRSRGLLCGGGNKSREGDRSRGLLGSGDGRRLPGVCT